MRAGDDLYVRAASGPDTGWHRVARTSHQARIWAGGVEHDVDLIEVGGDALDLVDEAYREKYGRHWSIVDGITDEQARATTLRLIALFVRPASAPTPAAARHREPKLPAPRVAWRSRA